MWTLVITQFFEKRENNVVEEVPTGAQNYYDTLANWNKVEHDKI